MQYKTSGVIAYWITSSAWKRSVGGIVRPRALAKEKRRRNVESFEPLDAKDRLVWRSLVGNELMTLAIDHQIKFFKHGDAQQNLFP